MLGAGRGDEAVLHHVADDGASHPYRRGVRSRFTMHARRDGDTLEIAFGQIDAAWRVQVRIVGCDGARQARIVTPAGRLVQPLVAHAQPFTGDLLALSIGDAFVPQAA